jgi:hypothetical protein
MTFDDALRLDREGRMEDATLAYEALLSHDPRNVTAIVNLIVLYWQATDFGVSATRDLSTSFVARAGERLQELLASANERFAEDPQVWFWRKYIAWADLGVPLDVQDCRNMLRLRPEYLEPALVLFSSSGGTEAEAEAAQLLNQCSQVGTARCRYVTSVIQGVLTRGGRPTPL